MKNCKECGTEITAANSTTSRATLCKKCYNEYAMKWRNANKDKVRTYAKKQYRNKTAEENLQIRLRSHGIDLERYEELLAFSDGRCHVCTRRPDKSLCIDHDHACCPSTYSCGKCVRGLLCDLCNRALGLMGDSPTNISALAAYADKGVWT